MVTSTSFQESVVHKVLVFRTVTRFHSSPCTREIWVILSQDAHIPIPVQGMLGGRRNFLSRQLVAVFDFLSVCIFLLYLFRGPIFGPG